MSRAENVYSSNDANAFGKTPQRRAAHDVSETIIYGRHRLSRMSYYGQQVCVVMFIPWWLFALLEQVTFY